MLRDCKGEKKVVEETNVVKADVVKADVVKADVVKADVVKADMEAMKNTTAWLKVKAKDLERRGIKWDKKT